MERNDCPRSLSMVPRNENGVRKLESTEMRRCGGPAAQPGETLPILGKLLTLFPSTELYGGGVLHGRRGRKVFWEISHVGEAIRSKSPACSKCSRRGTMVVGMGPKEIGRYGKSIEVPRLPYPGTAGYSVLLYVHGIKPKSHEQAAPRPHVLTCPRYSAAGTRPRGTCTRRRSG